MQFCIVFNVTASSLIFESILAIEGGYCLIRRSTSLRRLKIAS